ncbi:hypothetical protein PG996_012285 [Apiospora saccharicola]|uniref:Exocyst complex component Sec8 n=1 Tax=Apiospora saccharicola TaxID=335842 RepID=A0ABR1U4X4_9PEZI
MLPRAQPDVAGMVWAGAVRADFRSFSWLSILLECERSSQGRRRIQRALRLLLLLRSAVLEYALVLLPDTARLLDFVVDTHGGHFSEDVAEHENGSTGMKAGLSKAIQELVDEPTEAVLGDLATVVELPQEAAHMMLGYDKHLGLALPAGHLAAVTHHLITTAASLGRRDGR